MLAEFHQLGVGQKLAEAVVEFATGRGADVYGSTSAAGLPLYRRLGAELVGQVRLAAKREEEGGGADEEAPGSVVSIMRWRAQARARL